MRKGMAVTALIFVLGLSPALRAEDNQVQNGQGTMPSPAMAENEGRVAGDAPGTPPAAPLEVGETAESGKTCINCLPPLAKTIYLFGNLGYNRYRMDDVNQFLSNQNQVNILTLPDITGGGGGNFGAGFWLTDYLALGFEIGSLSAYSSSRNNGFRETLNLPAVESGIFARIGHRFWDRLILTAGGGFYGLNLEGATLVEHNPALSPFSYSQTRIYGYTYSTKVFGSAEVMLMPHVGLGLDAGYRWADIENQRIRLDGQRSELSNPDGSRLEIDFSGLFVNAGLRLYFR